MVERVAFASSSSEKAAGDRPPPAVKAKSWASSGMASLTIVTVAGFEFVYVQVTD